MEWIRAPISGDPKRTEKCLHLQHEGGGALGIDAGPTWYPGCWSSSLPLSAPLPTFPRQLLPAGSEDLSPLFQGVFSHAVALLSPYQAQSQVYAESRRRYLLPKLDIR